MSFPWVHKERWVLIVKTVFGFLLTMTDDEGNIHELGTNTFGLISTQSEEEIRELVSGLTQSATGKDPEITITTWEEWNSNRK
ncbi:type V toxin-antitoxin system endoribonuclease antitoxin GhoS [Escherichia coli]|nr:type V toxin-antitoxin system endoribonuclease antitoxin GhoS [Escherichia coli]